MPKAVQATLGRQLFVEKAGVPQLLMNRLIRLAAFQNPEFYRAQAMRMSTWNIPRIVGRAEDYPKHLGLPRGCLGVCAAEGRTSVNLRRSRVPLAGIQRRMLWTANKRRQEWARRKLNSSSVVRAVDIDAKVTIQ